MNDDFRYEIQTTSTAIFMFLSVMFEYRIINMMAMSLSKVTNIRWKWEDTRVTSRDETKEVPTVPLLLNRIIPKSSTGKTMVGQGDQLMRQSLLNRPAWYCCWFSQPLSQAGWAELCRERWCVNDDYDYEIGHRWDISVAFFSGDVCSVCKTSQGRVYHV